MLLAASQRVMPSLGQLDGEMGTALLEALDACNCRSGHGAVIPGSAGLAQKREWSTQFEKWSARYRSTASIARAARVRKADPRLVPGRRGRRRPVPGYAGMRHAGLTRVSCCSAT
jgi:hypothetical protein